MGGSDEYRRDSTSSMTGEAEKDWCGLGVFALDALDTLYLVGLEKEVEEVSSILQSRGTKNWLQNSALEGQSTFEMTIRVLGGLMGAYTVTNSSIFLEYAEALGKQLLGAWRGGEMLLPAASVSPKTGKGGSTHANCIAEPGTLQVEFLALAYASGWRYPYSENADRTMRYLIEESQRVNHSFAPYEIGNNGHLVKPPYRFTVGACADSYFEYLLKVPLQKGFTLGGGVYEKTWVKAMDEMLDMIHISPVSKGWYLVHSWDSLTGGNFEHLTCFVPGMLSLGLGNEEIRKMISPERLFLWERAAEELT